jgi:integrase
VLSGELAERLEAWVPRPDGRAGAAFARAVVAPLELSSWARARSLLWAASRLAAYGASVGIEAEEVLLSEPFIERFMAAGPPRWSAPARRTARSNLLFLATERTRSGPRRAALSRERALAPYSASELSSYLALCDTQPTEARRQRASGLIALGAGAGLVGADLRLVRGADVTERSGGVIVLVRGARPRHVPVRAELAARALGAAHWAGPSFIVGGAKASRRNVTSALIASLAQGPDLARLNLARLRSTWLAACAADIGLATFMRAAGVRCSQRLGDVVAHLEVGTEADAVALLGGSTR